jgi:hypothetical protein
MRQEHRTLAKRHSASNETDAADSRTAGPGAVAINGAAPGDLRLRPARRAVGRPFNGSYANRGLRFRAKRPPIPRWNRAADLPDVSNCFRRGSIHASDPFVCIGFLSLHGVVFDILVGRGQPNTKRGLPGRSSRAAPAFAQVGFGAAAFTRFASEGWWARQDSNLQPDRYEREDISRLR